jgi:hypothetical protein
MKSTSAILIPALLLLGACRGSSPQPTSMKGESPVPSAATTQIFYAEELVDGRIYVFGTIGAHEAFKKSHQKPNIAKTYIGAGAAGETVVLEADAKSPDLQERLRNEFNRRYSLHLP